MRIEADFVSSKLLLARFESDVESGAQEVNKKKRSSTNMVQSNDTYTLCEPFHAIQASDANASAILNF